MSNVTLHPVTRWLVFIAAWMVVLALIDHTYPWLILVTAAPLGFVTLILFDTWRGRRESRELGERTRKRFNAGDQSP
jgi:membrane protein implicated in regulation of membrane protease activity